MITNKRDAFKFKTAAESKSAKRVARNSWRYTRADGADCIRLHHTDVYARDPKGRITLDSGGWRTGTTKDRMNMGAGVSIQSGKGRWLVEYNGQFLPYADGMVLKPGKVKAGANAAAVTRETRQLAALDAFMKKVKALPQFPMPASGDCWLCCAVQAPGKAKIGFNERESRGSSCAADHVRESYIHGSLFVAALRWAGYQDTGIAYYLSQANKGEKWPRKVVLQSLRRYLKSAMGIGAQ